MRTQYSVEHGLKYLMEKRTLMKNMIEKSMLKITTAICNQICLGRDSIKHQIIYVLELIENACSLQHEITFNSE